MKHLFAALAAMSIAGTAAAQAPRRATNADIIAGLLNPPAGGTISVLPPSLIPIATPTALGGVKQGSGVTIAGDGTLSAAAGGLTVPTALLLGGDGSALQSVTVGSNLTLSGGALGVATNPTFTALNGWGPQFSVRDDSNPVPVAAGTGNAVGDALTLNDGCATHAVLTVSSVSGGGVATYNVTNSGSCAIIPSNPVGVLSSTGSGAGATFALSWLPSVNLGGAIYSGLPSNNGNLFIGPRSHTAYSGSESVFVGAQAGGNIVSGDFNTAFGLNACGIGAGVDITNAGAMLCFGTDAGRNITNGVSRDVIIGTGAGENMSGVDNVLIGNGNGNNVFTTGSQNVAIGGSSDSISTGAGNTLIGYHVTDLTPTQYNTVAIGGSSVGGGVGAQAPKYSVVIGTQAGNSTMAAGFGFTFLGDSAGATNCGGTAFDVIVIGTRGPDCAAANEQGVIHLSASQTSSGAGDVLRITGTETPSTSLATVYGTLNVATGYQSGGTAGVTCSGAPTASFATKNGIVTHC